jgi:hypothetical protein
MSQPLYNIGVLLVDFLLHVLTRLQTLIPPFCAVSTKKRPQTSSIRRRWSKGASQGT